MGLLSIEYIEISSNFTLVYTLVMYVLKKIIEFYIQLSSFIFDFFTSPGRFTCPNGHGEASLCLCHLLNTLFKIWLIIVTTLLLNMLSLNLIGIRFFLIPSIAL